MLLWYLDWAVGVVTEYTLEVAFSYTERQRDHVAC